MKFFGGMLKTAMENSGFDANQKFLFGSNRILESFGLNSGNNGSNSGPAANNGALSGDIQAASKWAESMVGHTGYGGNGCTEFVKNYLLHANSQLGKYMQDCSPIMDQVKKAAANNGDKPYETLMWVPTLYEWAKEQNMLKGPDQPGAEGDVCICNDIGHVVIADGKGGFWGNSSSRNQIIHSNSISQTFTIQGYIPTGSGSGTVSNDKKVLTAAQSNAEAGATNNAASGKHGRYGRGLPAYVEDFNTANSMDAVNVPFDIKSAASKDNFKTSMYGMRRHRKRLSSAPDTQKAIPKIEDFKQEDNNNPYTKIFSTQDAMFGNMNSIGEIKEFINSNYDTSKIPDYNMISDSDDLTVAKAKAANIVKKYPKKAGMGKYGMRRHHRRRASVVAPVIQQQKTFAQDPYSQIFNRQDYMFGDINSVSEIKKFIESNYDLSQVSDYNMINDDDSLVVAKAKASTIMKQCEKVPGIDTPTDNTPSATQSSTPAITQTRTFDNSKYGQIFGMQDYMFGDINSVSEIKKFIEDNYDVSQIPDYNMINDDDDLLVAKSKAANIVKQYTKIPGMGKGKYGMRRHHKNRVSVATPVVQQKTFAQDPYSQIFNMQDYMFGDIKSPSEIKEFINSNYDTSNIPDYNKINDDDDMTVIKAKAANIMKQYTKIPGIDIPIEPQTTKPTESEPSKIRTFDNSKYGKIFNMQDYMFDDINSVSEIKKFIEDNYDTSKIPDYNMIKDDDDLFVAKSKAANIVKQYTKIPGMGKGKYGRGLGGFISKAKNLFNKAKDIWNKIKPYKDKISSLFHHKKKDNKSINNDTKKDPKQLEEEYLKAHLITADIESMKTKDEIKNAIKDIPEDSILEYNKITDEDDLTVSKAKAKKTIELYNEEVRKKAKEYAANGGEDKSKTNESNAESSDKKEEPVVDEIAPNGEHYTKNDVDYLLSKGYTREAAIELLSKDKKYTTKKKDGKNEEVVEEIAPNGEHYSKNDVDYLMNNGYSREAAIALLSKDKKYTEKPEEKQEEKKKLNRRITDTYADDYDTPEERQKAREENDAKLKAEKEAKDKDEEVVEEVAPNGEHYSKNDVDYLLSKGYSRKAAIELLSKDKKYTEKPKDKKNEDKKTSKYAAEVAPNGKHYTNNDIQYLLDKGYSRQAAIELLSKDKKYTESTDEDDEEDEDEESDNDSKKTRRHRRRRRRLNTRITDTRSDDEENASEEESEKQLEKNEKRLRRRIRHRRRSRDEDYDDEDEDLEEEETTKKSKKYSKVKAPNGEFYETNDIKYLTDHGYSEKAAIELLSKDKKYTTKKYHHKRKYSKIQAPNGEYYSNNDIDYLMNNGYTKKAAIELLSKDKKYTTKKDDRKTAIEKIGDNASSVTKVSTSTADAKAAEENQKLKPIDVNVDNLRTKEEFDEALKDIPEDKILEYNKIQDGDDILVMRAKAKKTIALYNAYVKDHNDKIDKAEAEKKAKEDNSKDAKTPNKEESKKNEEAVSVGKKDEEKDSKDKDKNKDEKSKTKEFEYKDGKKHNMKLSDKVAPNGMHFLQNDIDYLVNKGYSEDDAIALLSEDPRYKEESDKTNNDNNGDNTPSGAVSAKTKENKKSKIDDLIAKQEETNKLLAAILQIATQYVGNTAAAPANNPKVNANETKNVNTGEVGSDIHSIKSALSKKYGGSKFGLGDGYMRQSTGRSYETIFHSLDLISTR